MGSTASAEGSGLPHACKCGARWAGIRTAHCTGVGCHATFSGPAAFDEHRRGGQCSPPATVGLVSADRAGYQVWGAEMDAEGRERLAGLRS